MKKILALVALDADEGGCEGGRQLETTGILCILMVVVVWTFSESTGMHITLGSYGIWVIL